MRQWGNRGMSIRRWRGFSAMDFGLRRLWRRDWRTLEGFDVWVWLTGEGIYVDLGNWSDWPARGFSFEVDDSLITRSFPFLDASLSTVVFAVSLRSNCPLKTVSRLGAHSATGTSRQFLANVWGSPHINRISSKTGKGIWAQYLQILWEKSGFEVLYWSTYR